MCILGWCLRLRLDVARFWGYPLVECSGPYFPYLLRIVSFIFSLQSDDLQLTAATLEVRIWVHSVGSWEWARMGLHDSPWIVDFFLSMPPQGFQQWCVCVCP